MFFVLTILLTLITMCLLLYILHLNRLRFIGKVDIVLTDILLDTNNLRFRYDLPLYVYIEFSPVRKQQPSLHVLYKTNRPRLFAYEAVMYIALNEMQKNKSDDGTKLAWENIFNYCKDKENLFHEYF